MSISTFGSLQGPFHCRAIMRGKPLGLLLCAVSLLAGTPRVSAQGPQNAEDQVVVDRQTLQKMMERIDQLEARVQQLEAGREPATPASVITPIPRAVVGSPSFATQAAPLATLTPVAMTSVSQPVMAALQPAAPAPPPGVAAPQPNVSKQMPVAGQNPSAQEVEQAQLENPMAERMDLSKTLLRIRGFGDISLGGGNQDASPATNMPAQTTSFALGELDLFITSDISEKFNFLTELVFEAGPVNYYGVQHPPINAFKVEPERYLMQYSYNDYLNISMGRFHTAIGYYNTAYHHSTWFQTTTDRPYLFAFEDDGGILPTHTVGVSATGLIPSGPLGLHYVAEVGNNRASQNPQLQEPVQNEVDDQNHKAFNLALFARPESIRGLEAGFSYYNDVLSPANQPRVGEGIFALHAVLERPKYEWLNEVVLVRHAIFNGGRVYNTPGFYSQVSRQFGSFRPYFRYQYLNVAKTEPIFPAVGLQYGPTVGLRYDASEFVALKFQYDYTSIRQPATQPGFSTLTLQIGFTF